MLIAALALPVAAPATAAAGEHAPMGNGVLVAYGTGVTTCTIGVYKWHYTGSLYYDFGGKTECTSPVQQTAVARFGGDVASGCSGLTTTCHSDGGWNGEPDPGLVYYHVTLVAPFGQGWAPPVFAMAPAWALPDTSLCSGVGSDRLDCTFTADNLGSPVL